MKPVRNAIVLVDIFRSRRLRYRQSCGRYRVGAKTEKEAEEFVRKAVGFGQVKFYYWDSPDSKRKQVGYGEVVRDFTYEPAKHAIDPINESKESN